MIERNSSRDGYVFKPLIRAPRLSDEVAEQMLESILSRGLRPGDRLPSERELGEQFGVSRTVIREASRSLVAKGVIEVRPGSGLVVAPFDPSAVTSSMSVYLRGGGMPYEKVHEVRTMIEIQVAGLAAERATADDLELLRAVHERFRSAVASDDHEAWAQADVEFHRTLARLTQNELYLVLLDSIGDVLLAIRRQTMRIPSRLTKVAQAHDRIVERVAARDAAGAQEAMRQHLEESFRAWVKLGKPVAGTA